MPFKIPTFPYVLVNKSVLCNCELDAESHFLLESLAACDDTKSHSEYSFYQLPQQSD